MSTDVHISNLLVRTSLISNWSNEVKMTMLCFKRFKRADVTKSPKRNIKVKGILCAERELSK